MTVLASVRAVHQHQVVVTGEVTRKQPSFQHCWIQWGPDNELSNPIPGDVGWSRAFSQNFCWLHDIVGCMVAQP